MLTQLVNLEYSRLDFIEDDYIPAKTKAAFVNFDWRITDALGLVTGVRYTEQEKQQAAFHAQPVNSRFNRVPNYYLLNGRVTWQSAGENWLVALEGTNLLDDLYYLTFFGNQGSTQNTLAQPAPPRQWAVTVKRSFR